MFQSKAVVIWLMAAATAGGATIEHLGTFFASGVSADGTTVIGTGSTLDGNRPFLWRNGTLTILESMPGQEHVFAQGISPDGTTVVGEDYNVTGYRWTESTGYTSLPELGIVFAASASGDIVVGQSIPGAVRWSESSGAQLIGPIAGGGLTESATDVSIDGSIVVGSGGADNGQTGFAFRWDAVSGAVSIGEYPYGQASGALATNSTGSIVVGSTVLNGVEEAFYWTQEAGLVGLGHLPAHEDTILPLTAAVALTDDGGLIIGNESVALGASGVFTWTPAEGMRPLDEYLIENHGLDLGDWTLNYVVDMTPDCRVIIGQGVHPLYGQNAVFRIVVPESSTLALGLCSLIAIAIAGSAQGSRFRRGGLRPGRCSAH